MTVRRIVVYCEYWMFIILYGDSSIREKGVEELTHMNLLQGKT